MGKLFQMPFYVNSDFAIALWEGEIGDESLLRSDVPMLRTDFACFTICLRGTLRMVKPSGVIGWSYGPGDHSDGGGDFDEVGIYKWQALDTPTQELCFSRLDSEGKDSDVLFNRAVIDANEGVVVAAPVGFAVVVRGAFETPKGVFRAPHFAVVTKASSLVAVDNGSRLITVTT